MEWLTMPLKNKKIISLLVLSIGLVVGLILFPSKNKIPQLESPTTQIEHSTAQNEIVPAPSTTENSVQPAGDTYTHTAQTQELSPEMQQAINSFVGKGREGPKIEKLKGGGNIAHLDGRYRHVTVVTIDDSGVKKTREYGPHGVEEGK